MAWRSREKLRRDEEQGTGQASRPFVRTSLDLLLCRGTEGGRDGGRKGRREEGTKGGRDGGRKTWREGGTEERQERK